jgi:hypothetical protein
MLVRNEATSSRLATWDELECRMAELIAMRRAICLLKALRDRPKGSRRRLYRTRLARGTVCYRR